MPTVFPPRLDVARLPTPTIALERLSSAWGAGATIWIKRDDQTDAVLTGNKIRKLQYVVREALDQGCDTLVTCGGIQSNHCRATAALARQVGLEAVLVLRGQPSVPVGNHFLDLLFGAQIRWVDAETYRAHDRLMQQIAAELRAAGRRPFVISEGASMPMGCWGYVEAAAEIAETERQLGVRFDAIVHAVGSGGTSAGLELGLRMHDVAAPLFGVPVCDDGAHFRELVARLCNETAQRFGISVRVPADALRFIDGYVGDGYGRSRPEERRTILEVARTEGLALDPVYSGKAMHALRHELGSGCLAGARNVLFIHTGGVFGLFAHAADLVESS